MEATHSITWILEIGIILLAARVAGEFFRRIGATAVVGEITVGVLLGAGALHLVGDSAILEAFAEWGVIILIFSLGLETRFSQFRAVGPLATIVATGGVVLPLALGYVVSMLWGYPWQTSFFMGAVFSATSISLSTRLLLDMGLARSRASRVILAAAVIDDVMGLFILAIVVLIVGTGSAAGGEQSLWPMILKIGAFLVVGLPIAGYLLPRVLVYVRRFGGETAGLVVVVGLTLLISWLAGLSGLEPIIGAFFAGSFLAESPLAKDVEHEVEPLVRVLAPIFFVSIGLKVMPEALVQSLGFALVLTIVAVATKVFGCGIPSRLFGIPWRESWVIGIGMVPRGEVGLIVAGIAHRTGYLKDESFSAATFVCVVTILVVPPLFRWIGRGAQAAESLGAEDESTGSVPKVQP